MFPRTFPNRDGNYYGASAKLSSGNSSKTGWTPPTPGNAKNIQLTSVVMGSSNNSDDRIINNSTPGSPTLSDGTISKVTQFSVKYGHRHSDVSAMS